MQERSLIRTKQLAVHWIGDVLSRVARGCVERREPLLSALCVDTKGHVSPAYAVSVEMLRHEVVDDPDDHAARERLACHRWFGADLPAGGGEPVVTVRAAAVRRPRAATPSRTPGTRAATSPSVSRAAPAPVPTPLVVCPVHFTVLPNTGICDDCD